MHLYALVTETTWRAQRRIPPSACVVRPVRPGAVAGAVRSARRGRPVPGAVTSRRASGALSGRARCGPGPLALALALLALASGVPARPLRLQATASPSKRTPVRRTRVRRTPVRAAQEKGNRRNPGATHPPPPPLTRGIVITRRRREAPPGVCVVSGVVCEVWWVSWRGVGVSRVRGVCARRQFRDGGVPLPSLPPSGSSGSRVRSQPPGWLRTGE